MEKPKSKQPIPQHAKKVFTGVMFDVYQWEQEMYDGSRRTFEKVKRSNSVEIIPFTREGKIIILNQQQPGREPYFSFPGGVIDEGENPIEAAKRELLEETGYSSEDMNLYNAYQPVTKLEWECYSFVAKNCKKIAVQDLDGGEKIKVLEVSVEEFLEMLLDRKIKSTEIVLKFLKENVLVINKEKSLVSIRKHFNM
ncbi:MAG: NUDIX hydrolase [uncultured bacterium]|nr:MAG: NUDIX hydrolase [uncultured bacterium]